MVGVKLAKVALMVISLVEEAEDFTDGQLEAEIKANIDLSKIPWGKRLIRVLVFNTTN